MGNKKAKPKPSESITSTKTNTTSSLSSLSQEEIDYLKERTEYGTQEILSWHDSFMKECPNGFLDKKTLIKSFEKIYPNGKPEKICTQLFNAFDNDKNRRVDFTEYLIGVSHLSSLDTKKKLQLTFKIYDQDNNGKVNRKEMEKMIISILDLNGIKDRSGPNNPKLKAKNIFKKFNKDLESYINEEEFINGCLADDNLIDLLAEYRI